MMRLPKFRYLAPETIEEACEVLAGEGPEAMVLAGGTDLVPNMKRRQQQPKTLVALGRIGALREQVSSEAEGVILGSRTTLSEVAMHPFVRARHTALAEAAARVATPLIRNQATLGGNICLDTRCLYYNQNAEWRKAIDQCMKAPGSTGGVFTNALFVAGSAERQKESGDKQGAICWVAPGSPRCWAVSSTDSAPALVALGATVELASKEGIREIPISDLYQNDGMAYMTKKPHEILTRVRMSALAGWKSTYWKLRRRGAFDFPVLGVAAAVKIGAGGDVEQARIVLGAVASYPVMAEAANAAIVGGPLTDERIAQAAELAAKLAKPLDNTDFSIGWRKAAAKTFVEGALRELRGDDPATLGALAKRVRRTVALPVISA